MNYGNKMDKWFIFDIIYCLAIGIMVAIFIYLTHRPTTHPTQYYPAQWTKVMEQHGFNHPYLDTVHDQMLTIGSHPTEIVIVCTMHLVSIRTYYAKHDPVATLLPDPDCTTTNSFIGDKEND